MDFGEENHRGKVPFLTHHVKVPFSTHILSIRLIIVDVDRDPLAQEVFGRFLHCKVTVVFPFSYCPLWRKITVHNPHLRNRKSYSICLKLRHLYKLFAAFLNMKIFYSPQFINNTIIYNSMDSWIFMFGLSSNTILFCCLDYVALAIGRSFSCLL